MALRKIVLTVVGHVDHGKTSLLDNIRKTVVAKGEAGGITQTIGASIVPLATIQKICGKLLDIFQGKLTVPGFLCIDTPGHAAFTSLRRRGGSLADIAILVIDINEGVKPQTIESIEILKANKVPFVIAATKIDLLNGWAYDPEKFLLDNVQALDFKIQGELEKKTYDLIAQLQEQGVAAERFDRITDYTQQFALIPLSTRTGQGIPELLMVLIGLAQRFLEQRLHIDETGIGKGTILEVTEEKGLGITLNVLLYNGMLRVNDTFIIGGLEEPIVTKIRALFEPPTLAEMREKKGKFLNVKEVTAATGVKIAAPGVEQAIAGMPVRGCHSGDELDPSALELLKEEVQQEVREVLTEEEQEAGVLIKADTLGGLEALRHLLRERKIPIAAAALGDVTKKDLSTIASLKEKDQFWGILLGFNINVPPDIQELADSKGLKLAVHDVIYRILEEYEATVTSLKKEIELKELASVVRPAKFQLLKGYLFRQSNPAIIGVAMEIGTISAGNPVMNGQGKALTSVKSMQEGQETIHTASQGKQLAMSLEQITIGRQVQEGEYLYTDIPEQDFKKLKTLKKYLSPKEWELLKEIAEMKRKENPLWGVG